MENYIKNFFDELGAEMQKISWLEIAKAIKILHSTYENNGRIFMIGNGGSSAIASHFANDLNKTVLGHAGNKQIKRFQAMTLSDNVPVLTAWANDVGFESVFSEQLKNFGGEKDTLLAISSGGKSPNIIKAAKTAKDLNMSIVGLMGFDGGELLNLSDAKIHVPSFKYGIVESAHSAICHMITTYFEELL
ncbi:MAG: SIS domain-containing protein [Candidatus Nealsonbacteria bacterium]